MIISASYKTDIPTFYGEWFINRLRAGYCKMVNPYSRQISTIELSPESVDGFVFWTKNVGPFLKYLPEVRQTSVPFIVQHTINGYPRELESRVIHYEQTVEHMKCFAGEYGSDRLVWRYDPIIFSSLTDSIWHLKAFAMLAKLLEGTTDEVVVSFAQLYKKTARNVDNAAREHGFSWEDHKSWESVREKGRKLVAELAEIARIHNMHLKVCSQKEFLVGDIEEAHCIDAERLEHVAGGSLMHRVKQKGNRKECGCFASRDIGEYDTCPHGCVYCYAVQNRPLALHRYQAHDALSEFLFPPKNYIPDDQEQTSPLISVQKRSHYKVSNIAKKEIRDPLDNSLTLWTSQESPNLSSGEELSYDS